MICSEYRLTVQNLRAIRLGRFRKLCKPRSPSIVAIECYVLIVDLSRGQYYPPAFPRACSALAWLRWWPGYSAYFKITPFKDQGTAKAILGDLDGLLGSDRAKTYAFIPIEKSQTCSGHVDRHFQRMDDRGGESGIVGQWGKAELDRFFHSWHQFKRKEIQLRRTSFGTKSDGGSRFVERMLTVVETCRLQRRNLYSFLKESVQGFLRGVPAPMLLVPGLSP